MTTDFKTYLEHDAAEVEADGKFVSKPRMRHDFVLKLIERKTTSRGYYVYRFVDRHDNKFIAFDGRDGFFVDTQEGLHSHRVEKDECFTCKATIIRHEVTEYKYGSPDSKFKQNVINRIKPGKLVS
tara:strand:+ start:1146 stop:1523 length:378 start_codon:yes stop_codon:yes gene_type:complete